MKQQSVPQSVEAWIVVQHRRSSVDELMAVDNLKDAVWLFGAFAAAYACLVPEQKLAIGHQDLNAAGCGLYLTVEDILLVSMRRPSYPVFIDENRPAFKTDIKGAASLAAVAGELASAFGWARGGGQAEIDARFARFAASGAAQYLAELGKAPTSPPFPQLELPLSSELDPRSKPIFEALAEAQIAESAIPFHPWGASAFFDRF